MAYENFYDGASYGMESGGDSLYTGSSVPQGSIGSSTGAMTANQLGDVATFLNQGMNTIEVGAVQPEVFEMIPDQHLKEINRIAKLTKVDVSMHAPIIEASGFTQQGQWNEAQREQSERQMTDVVLRASKLSPDKPMPVTMHASAVIPGSQTMPVEMFKDSDLTPKEREYVKKHKELPTQMIAVNQESGQMMPLVREKVYRPGKEGEIWSPEERLESANNTQWTKQVTDLVTHKKLADDVIRNVTQDQEELKMISEMMNTGRLQGDQLEQAKEKKEQLKNNINAGGHKAHLLLNDVMTSFGTVYETAAKYGSDEAKEELKGVSEKWNDMRNGKIDPSSALDFSLAKLDKIGNERTGIEAPQIFKAVDEFAIEKSSKTFANVAFNAYKKHGDKAPFVSIENPPYGGAIARAKDLKKLIKESRKQFTQKAINEKGMSKSEAERAAEAMIGATWDTSHSSMMRQQGFKKKHLTKEAETIAPFVKHVHLNDNFGYSHTDLPPGMGDVPIGDIMKKLKEKGYKGKHIFEGGNFFQHFKTAPHAMVLQAMGSPIYAAQAGPSWTQTYGTMGTYSGGYGPLLPSNHFSTYGAGFSGLPQELGGQMSNAQSRFSGAPNQ